MSIVSTYIYNQNLSKVFIDSHKNKIIYGYNKPELLNG
jgi:hypothetical protein